tara:strand:- start:1336 stop:1740 length:405 start_codon:yes stop_codon:yes gene_type:complete
MKSKAPFILILIGIIIGFLASLIGIVQYFMFKSIETNQGAISEFFGGAGVNLGTMMGWALISSIIGLVLSIVLIFYLIKIKRNPTKGAFIVILILGIIGIPLGMGLGGILVLIGGIVGIVKVGQPEEVAPQQFQ